MQNSIILSGLLILVSAFTYSAITTLNRSDSVVSKELVVETIRETMPMMDGVSMSMHNNGTYKTMVKYEVPYGYVEPMYVSLTIESGVITGAEVSFEVENPVSADYQEVFKRYYKEEIVGQLVEEVSLSRMGGASLTNNAFDSAVARIKAEVLDKRWVR